LNLPSPQAQIPMSSDSSPPFNLTLIKEQSICISPLRYISPCTEPAVFWSFPAPLDPPGLFFFSHDWTNFFFWKVILYLLCSVFLSPSSNIRHRFFWALPASLLSLLHTTRPSSRSPSQRCSFFCSVIPCSSGRFLRRDPPLLSALFLRAIF